MPVFINNYYDRLYKEPFLEKDELFIEQELLAESMVKNGLLRVSANERCNFVILPLRGGNEFLSFSKRELYEPKLLERTYKTIRKNQTPIERASDDETPEIKVEVLRRMLSKYMEVSEDYEMKLARMLVQTNHSAIISNMIYEGVNFFVSFGHTVSDLLNVRMWESSRYASGLQSNDLHNSSVFVSCGGNPFFEPDKEDENKYDGWNAKARLMIVAAQEIAHHADIIKNQHGQNIGRASANVYMNAPNPECEKARQKDIERINYIIERLERSGVRSAFDLERRFRIQIKYRKYTIGTIILFLRKILAQKIFLMRAKVNRLNFLPHVKNRKEVAQEALIIAGDMMFNLEPEAPVYRNDDEDIEKAIMCAEALARVPQQELKWGKKCVKYFAPNMYRYFYEKIIPDELNLYYNYFGERFDHTLTKPKKKIIERMIK